MTYIVTDACIRCKFTDCVEVCPVCEPECPIEAIKPDTEDDADGKWLALNSKYATEWPNITVRKDPPADYKEFETITNKLEKYFSEKPAS
jgi:ferredoxin